MDTAMTQAGIVDRRMPYQTNNDMRKAINAGQFVYYMRKELDVDKLLSEGKMEEIADYLKEHIHKYGNTVTPSEVIIRATGESFNPKYYIDYLKEKYTKLYEIA